MDNHLISIALQQSLLHCRTVISPRILIHTPECISDRIILALQQREYPHYMPKEVLTAVNMEKNGQQIK